MIQACDGELLYKLASELAQVAATPENITKVKQWIEHNAMRDNTPMILAFMEKSFDEVVPPDSLMIEDPFLRSVERDLKQRLYHAKHLKDDTVFESVYRMRAVYDDQFDWGMKPVKKMSNQEDGSYAIIPCISSDEDVVRLKSLNHDWVFDDVETKRRLDLLDGIFGKVLPAKPTIPFYTSSLVFQLVPLYGLEELMVDLILEPERIHDIMEFMCTSLLRAFHKMENEHRIISNNTGISLPSGSFGYSDELKGENEGPFGLSDLWGFADTQEFTEVSASMWREFVLPYQKKLLSEFGLVYYGCCEKLDQKLDDILTISNLRKISVSPWSDIHIAEEKIQQKAIYCRKVNPSEVIYCFDENAIRAQMKELKQVSNNCFTEVVLKDLHTCNHHPEHISRWIEIARNVVLS